MASDIWFRTILIVRKETRCRHIGYSFRLTARVLLYAPSHREDSTYNGLCYTSRGVLAGTRNSSMGPPPEGSVRRPIAPWANALTAELYLAPYIRLMFCFTYYVNPWLLPENKTHKCVSLFGENFSFMSRWKWMAMLGMRRMGRLMWTSRWSILAPFWN